MATEPIKIPRPTEIKVKAEFNGTVESHDYKLYMALIQALRQIVK